MTNKTFILESNGTAMVSLDNTHSISILVVRVEARILGYLFLYNTDFDK